MERVSLFSPLLVKKLQFLSIYLSVEKLIRLKLPFFLNSLLDQRALNLFHYHLLLLLLLPEPANFVFN